MVEDLKLKLEPEEAPADNEKQSTPSEILPDSIRPQLETAFTDSQVTEASLTVEPSTTILSRIFPGNDIKGYAEYDDPEGGMLYDDPEEAY